MPGARLGPCVPAGRRRCCGSAAGFAVSLRECSAAPPGPLREPPELAGCQDTRQGGGAAAGPCGASNPSALTDLTGGADAGRYGAHLGPSGARSWGRQSREDARAPAGRRRCCGPPGRTVGPPGAVRAGRCPGKHSKWLSICKISGALARMLFPIFGFCSQVKIYPFCYTNPWGDTWREKKTAGTIANTGFIFLFSLEKSDIALLSLFSNEILLIYGIF